MLPLSHPTINVSHPAIIEAHVTTIEALHLIIIEAHATTRSVAAVTSTSGTKIHVRPAARVGIAVGDALVDLPYACPLPYACRR